MSDSTPTTPGTPGTPTAAPSRLRVGVAMVFEGDDLASIGLPVPVDSPRAILRVTDIDESRGTITVSTSSEEPR